MERTGLEARGLEDVAVVLRVLNRGGVDHAWTTLWSELADHRYARLVCVGAASGLVPRDDLKVDYGAVPHGFGWWVPVRHGVKQLDRGLVARAERRGGEAKTGLGRETGALHVDVDAHPKRGALGFVALVRDPKVHHDSVTSEVLSERHRGRVARHNHLTSSLLPVRVPLANAPRGEPLGERVRELVHEPDRRRGDHHAGFWVVQQVQPDQLRLKDGLSGARGGRDHASPARIDGAERRGERLALPLPELGILSERVEPVPLHRGIKVQGCKRGRTGRVKERAERGIVNHDELRPPAEGAGESCPRSGSNSRAPTANKAYHENGKGLVWEQHQTSPDRKNGHSGGSLSH